MSLSDSQARSLSTVSTTEENPYHHRTNRVKTRHANAPPISVNGTRSSSLWIKKCFLRSFLRPTTWTSNRFCALLFRILFAFNNLATSSDVGCKTVANMIKGKTPEEIRKLFNIVNDFTPEEEVSTPEPCLRVSELNVYHDQAQIKKENVSKTPFFIRLGLIAALLRTGMGGRSMIVSARGFFSSFVVRCFHSSILIQDVCYVA